ncbi:hypothetical protein [Ralstonia solanacearum]|uniref:hypothetical protein n=1 Tax=Ralstonia solanacearum TaxID=305 RepID=UPI000B14C79C|nr:hypothetical protein [Ralstonia solanacearum]
MAAFKSDLHEICRAVADEFPGWGFSSGQFKSKALRHTDLIIHLGLGFGGCVTPVQPSVNIINKRISKLCKDIFRVDGYASTVGLQTVAHALQYTLGKLRTGFWVEQDRAEFLALGQASTSVEDVRLDMIQARSALIATTKDGISFIENHYDLGDEDGLLRGLPAKYETSHVNSPCDQMSEEMKLISVGFFKDLLYGYESSDSLESSRSTFVGSDMEEVLAYLRSGTPFVVAPGISRDYMFAGREIIGALALLTDGKFIWTSDLAYYVEKYRVGIPLELLMNMRMNGWKVPSVDVSGLEM